MDRAGVVGDDGPTHHGVFDISFLRAIPNMTVVAPRTGSELEAMLAWALEQPNPVAIRYPRAALCGAAAAVLIRPSPFQHRCSNPAGMQLSLL